MTLGMEVLGIFALLAMWEGIGMSGLAGSGLPPPSHIFALLFDPALFGLFLRAALSTLSAAAMGFVIGGLAGLGLAMAGEVFPALREGNARMNAWVHAIPMIALGPIFVILLGVDQAPIAMATLSVLFSFYVTANSGFSGISGAHRDLFKVFGATASGRFRLLDVPATMPDLAVAIKLSIPRALLGAIIGEWFGAQRGLGVLMATAMQEVRIPLLWSAVIIATLLSMALYSIGTMLERAAVARYR